MLNQSQLKLTDGELMALCLQGKSIMLPRFAINYFLNKKSEILLEYAQYFSNNTETRLTFLISSGQKLTQDDFTLNEVSLNDFPIIHGYFEKWGGNFYDHVDFAPLLNNLQYNASLGAHLIQNLTKSQISDFAFPSEFLEDRHLSAKVNIFGITKIKDEGDLPNIAIRNWLEICDHIIVSDASEASTIDRDLSIRPNLTIIDQAKPYHEKVVYDQLYQECRKLGATHILHFDVDEMFDTTTDLKHLRSLVGKMAKGEALAVEWPQVFRVDNNFFTLDYKSTFQNNSFHRLLPPYKDLIFCDDGKSHHCDLAHHCPTITQNFPTRRFYTDLKMYHLEGLVFKNAISKYNAWWDADYNINQDTELAFTRYLPSLLKYQTIQSNRAHFNSIDCRLFDSLQKYSIALQSNLDEGNQTGGMRTLAQGSRDSQTDKRALFDLFKLSV